MLYVAHTVMRNVATANFVRDADSEYLFGREFDK